MKKLPTKPPTFQVRHKEYGVFQACTGPGFFWHPVSGVPELGLAKFTEEAAHQFIHALDERQIIPATLLQIEPHDDLESERLRTFSIMIRMRMNDVN